MNATPLSCSIAILKYLAEKFRTPDHWYPADLQKRARVNEYLAWQHTAIRAHGSKVFWFRVSLRSLSLRVFDPCVVCLSAISLLLQEQTSAEQSQQTGCAYLHNGKCFTYHMKYNPMHACVYFLYK